MFGCPDKNGKTSILCMLTICESKSIALELSAENNDMKHEWVSAIRAANNDQTVPIDSKTKSTSSEPIKCYGSEQDCQCNLM